jgi:hypothetical protein
VFLVAGGTFLVAARAFAMGTPADIGPGFFPTVVAALLALVGAGLAVRGLVIDGTSIGRVRKRPAVLVLAGLAAFGLLVDHGGLVLAIAALVGIASAAEGRPKPLQTAILALALIALAVVVFRLGLGIQIKLWPSL